MGNLGTDFNIKKGMAPIGKGFAIPKEVTITYEGDDVPYEVTLVATWDGSRLRCTSLTCEARKEEVTSEGLRKVPVAGLMRLGLTSVLHRKTGRGWELVTSLPEFDTSGRGPSDEILEWVAAIYRLAHATHLNPTQGVAEALELPRSTAGRWVMTARQKGLLGPTVEGKAGG